MNHVLVGTTSWSEKTLVESGEFYPADVKTPEDRLRYYATQFPLTEVDSTYYGLLNEHNAMLWVERTPPAFVFDVKAFRLFTHHQTPPSALPKDVREALALAGEDNLYYDDLPAEALDELWQRFRMALEPLRLAERLGAVLFQFPPWFYYRRRRLEYLEVCARKLAPIPIAVEFRHRSWLEDRHRAEVLAFERERGLTHVVVDEPQGTSGSVPPVWSVTTAQLAIVRLHGRSHDTWHKKDLPSAAERFRYLYSGDELEEFVEPIHRLAREANSVHVLFNNCYRDYAQRNAAQMSALIL